MATIVTRAGKGSALTHAEVDANFNNLNNVWPNVAAPIGASNLELDLLDGVTATTAELNKVDDSAAAVAGFVSGMRTHLNTDGASTTSFNAYTNITESTFESIGPTGSSATNIWTAMDSIPAGAKLARILVSMSGTGSGATISLFAYARQTGSAQAVGAATTVFASQVATTASAQSHVVEVPLDANLRFDFTWAITGETGGQGVTLYLKGFSV